MNAAVALDFTYRTQVASSHTRSFSWMKRMSVTEQLQTMVCDYLDTHPNISINGLAKRSGVAATTIRRLINQETKKSIAPHTVLNLVSSISKEKRLGKLLTMFEGELGELLKDNFSAFADEAVEASYDQQLSAVLSEPTAYFVYKLCSNRTGISHEIIKEIFGAVGLQKIEQLLELNLIEAKDDNYHAKEGNFSLDVKIAAKHLPELMKYYKPSQIEMKKNMFYSLSESISEEGIQKIKEIQKEAVQKTYQVMQSPFYEGDIPYFTVQVCDTLVPELSEGALQ